MTGDWLPLAQRVLCCEWVDDGWCETHDDPWPCGRAQEAADVLTEELDQPTKEQKMSNDTPTQIDPEHVEAVARALFAWNTPTDPHFVIHGRAGRIEDRDPYEPIAEAILTSTDPAVHAALLAALVRAGADQ